MQYLLRLLREGRQEEGKLKTDCLSKTQAGLLLNVLWRKCSETILLCSGD